MCFRGYILIRIKTIGTEWKVAEKLSRLKSANNEEKWSVTYVTPVYGNWDIIVECSFSNLKELNKIETFIRLDEDLSQWIEETTTLIGTNANFK